MTKKDRERLADLLSNSYDLPEFKSRIFQYDSKLKEEYEDLEYFEGRSDKVLKLFEEKMERENTKNWALIKKSMYVRPTEEVLEECRKEVYGEDYHPSLFERKTLKND